MRKPPRGRQVKSTESALARTNRPIGADEVMSGDAYRHIRDAAREVTESVSRTGDGFENLLTGIGTGLDKRTSSQFTVARQLTQMELEGMYRGSWPAAKLVDALPEDATQEWLDYEWEGHDDEGSGVQVQAIRDADRELDLRGAMRSAAKWGRLYGGGAIIPSIKGDRDWSKPLIIDRIPKGGIEMFHVLDRYRLYAEGAIDKTPGPNFGRPLYYGIAEAAAQVSRIHWTRVLIFRGKELPYFEWQRNGRWDDSVLQHTQDNIRDYEDVRAQVNAMVPESNVDILKVPGLAAMVSTPAGLEKLKKRIEIGASLKSALRIWVMEGDDPVLKKAGEDYDQKVSQFSGVNAVLEAAKDDLAGAFDMPMTKLFGRSPGGLNSTGDSDAKNWNNKVTAFQTTELQKPARRATLMLARHTFGSIPKNFGHKWKPLSSPTIEETAANNKVDADRDVAYVTAGVLPPQAIARELLDRKTYRTLTPKDIARIEEMAAAEADAEARAEAEAAKRSKAGGKVAGKTGSQNVVE